MKTLICSLLVIFSVFGLFAQDNQNKENQSKAEIKFDKLVHNFGEVLQGKPTECEFEFKNVGTEPLILSDVKSSCGCTVPEWPKQPIMPGQSAKIKVRYDSNRIGQINKQITVISNAKNSPTVLKITGNVKELPKEILPLQMENSVLTPNKN